MFGKVLLRITNKFFLKNQSLNFNFLCLFVGTTGSYNLLWTHQFPTGTGYIFDRYSNSLNSSKNMYIIIISTKQNAASLTSINDCGQPLHSHTHLFKKKQHSMYQNQKSHFYLSPHSHLSWWTLYLFLHLNISLSSSLFHPFSLSRQWDPLGGSDLQCTSWRINDF